MRRMRSRWRASASLCAGLPGSLRRVQRERWSPEPAGGRAMFLFTIAAPWVTVCPGRQRSFTHPQPCASASKLPTPTQSQFFPIDSGPAVPVFVPRRFFRGYTESTFDSYNSPLLISGPFRLALASGQNTAPGGQQDSALSVPPKGLPQQSVLCPREQDPETCHSEDEVAIQASQGGRNSAGFHSGIVC